MEDKDIISEEDGGTLFYYDEGGEVRKMPEEEYGPKDMEETPPEIWSVQGLWNDIEKVEERKPKERDYISFGDIGKTDYWSRYMKMNATPETNPFNPRILRVFQAGDEFHNLIKTVFKKAGVFINSQDDLDEEGNPQWSEIAATDTTLKQFGAYDILVGGKPNIDKALSWIEESDLSHFMKQKAQRIANAMKERFPDGLKPMIYEIKSINCVAKGELIYTTKGLKKIENIKKGDKIYSIQDDLSLVRNKVKNLFKGGKKEIYKITTKTGKTILVTEKHKFLTTNVKYLADKNILPKNVLWKELKDIKVGNKIAVVNKYPDNELKVRVNKEISLVLGYLVGDGHINKRFQSNIVVVEMNEALLIKNILDKNFDLDCQIKKYKSLNGILRINLTGGIKNRKGAGNLSNKFLNFLRENKINKIKDKKEIPEIILNSNNEIIANFLKGLFQADGWCSKHGNGVQIGYGTISEKLAGQVSHCLLRLGIQNSLHKVNHKNSGFKSKYLFFYQINIRSFSINKFADIVGFIDYKDRRLKKLLKSWKPNSKNRKENIFFDIVKEIKKIGITDVYDIEVESKGKDRLINSFCCKDIVVHNSQAFWGKKGYLHEAYPHHKHQALGYLRANHKNPKMIEMVKKIGGLDIDSIDEARLLYISKDDLVMAEFPISLNDQKLAESYDNDIKTMSHYILNKKEPPKPDYIIFDSKKRYSFQDKKTKYKVQGCYRANWEIERSPFFNLMTEFETTKEWQQSLRDEISEKNKKIKERVLNNIIQKTIKS